MGEEAQRRCLGDYAWRKGVLVDGVLGQTHIGVSETEAKARCNADVMFMHKPVAPVKQQRAMQPSARAESLRHTQSCCDSYAQSQGRTVMC